MGKPRCWYEVWEECCLCDGEIVFRYVDTFEDPTMAIELCRWNQKYKMKKLGRDGKNENRTGSE